MIADAMGQMGGLDSADEQYIVDCFRQMDEEVLHERSQTLAGLVVTGRWPHEEAAAPQSTQIRN